MQGADVVEISYGEIQGLPDPVDGVLYIVSTLLREVARRNGRIDVISPDTSPEGAVRDSDGKIVGTRGWQR